MNDDQCEGCEDELAKVVSAILGLAGKGAALVIKGMAAGSLGKWSFNYSMSHFSHQYYTR